MRKLSQVLLISILQVLVEATGHLREAVPEPPAADHERLQRRRPTDPVDGLHVPEHVPVHQRDQGQAQHHQEMRAAELQPGNKKSTVISPR